VPQKNLKKKNVILKKILLAVMLVVFIVLVAITGTNKENIETWFAEKTKEAIATENADTTRGGYEDSSQAEVINKFNLDAKLENTDTITYIYTAEELNAFRDSVNAGDNYAGKTVYLMADIDMSSVCSSELGSWTPIGNTTYFAGTFDGNYHTINNLYINKTAGREVYVGLFNATENTANIQNLLLENVNIYAEYAVGNTDSIYVGGITGCNQGKILNCGVQSGSIIGKRTVNNTTGNIWPRAAVGGIAGCHVNTGIISDCYNKANIQSYSPRGYYNQTVAGGIVGANHGNVQNSYNSGNIYGNSYWIYIGGITGWSGYSSGPSIYIQNCYNLGIITGSYNEGYNIAGITGLNGWSGFYNTSISNSYCTTETTYSTLGNSTSQGGRVEKEKLKTYASQLGIAYEEDIFNINDGYPVLWWENPSVELNVKQEYIKEDEKLQINVTVATNEKRIIQELGREINNSDFIWSSYNDDVASIDENGLITAKSIGYTTITGTNETLGLKARAFITVYRNREGAITIPQVELGEGFTVVLKEDGTVWTAGLNSSGQLGDGTTTNRDTFTQVETSETNESGEHIKLTNIRKIGVGGYGFVLALTTQGEVYAWGSNECGQLGQNNTTNLLYATKVLDSTGQNRLKDIIDIVAGCQNSMVLTAEGKMYSWGDGSSYKLGTGNTNQQLLPVKINIDNVVKIENAQSCSPIIFKSNGKHIM